MKQIMRWSWSVMWLLALPALNAQAQDPAENLKAKLAAEVQAKVEIAKTLGTQFGFETKVVKGAPYSATTESETIQMLADGNRIRSKTTTTVYRDSEGRTRREVAGKTPGVAGEVFISDPVSYANYALDPQQRAAVKSPPNLLFFFSELKRITEKQLGAQQAAETKSNPGEFKPPATININGQAVRWEQLDEAQRADIQAKMSVSKEELAKQPAAGGFPMKKRRGTQESLGQQMIEGIRCEGTRTTLTIPANSIGNDLPINIVSEEWHAPELQILVLTKHSDPRHGETTYRLTNLNRSEPDRTLFEVPADYTVRENKMLAKPKIIKEEE